MTRLLIKPLIFLKQVKTKLSAAYISKCQHIIERAIYGKYLEAISHESKTTLTIKRNARVETFSNLACPGMSSVTAKVE